MKPDRNVGTTSTLCRVHKTGFLLLIATLAPCVAAAHVVRHNSIPEPYLGKMGVRGGELQKPGKPG